MVCEAIKGERAGHWPDVAAWYWDAAVLGNSRGPWWSIVVAERDPTAVNESPATAATRVGAAPEHGSSLVSNIPKELDRPAFVSVPSP